MAYVIGLFVGVAAGLFQLWLLTKFISAVTSGSFSVSKAFLGILQFVLPVAVLFGAAFLIRQELIWTGCGLAATLMIGAIVKFILYMRKSRGHDNNGA